MNLWERAKSVLAKVADRMDMTDPNTILLDEVYAVLADMERVECVEGGAYTYRGEPVSHDFNEFRRPEDRPALLLLLPTEAPHE